MNFAQTYETTEKLSLAELVRPSGYYNQKARKLKGFCQHVSNAWQGDLDGFLALETDTLRHELLRIRGVGPETADSIVLYAAEKPSFVVDTYTYRIFSHHGWIPEELSYEEIAKILGCSLSATKSLIHRARETLKQKLKPYLRSGAWHEPQ